MAPTVIEVRLPAALRTFASESSVLEVTTSTPMTLAEVLARIGDRAPGVTRRIIDETGALRRHVNVYVNAEECRHLAGLATPVAPGSAIHVMSAISGG